MTYERVAPNVAANLVLDEERIGSIIESLYLVAVADADRETRVLLADSLVKYLRSRLERDIPNEGQPLPHPYVRVPLGESNA